MMSCIHCNRQVTVDIFSGDGHILTSLVRKLKIVKELGIIGLLNYHLKITPSHTQMASASEMT